MERGGDVGEKKEKTKRTERAAIGGPQRAITSARFRSNGRLLIGALYGHSPSLPIITALSFD